MGHKEFAFKVVFSILFVLLGGVFSGLSLGLMGLDSTNLQVLATSAPPADRRDAQKVLKLLSHGRHFVLCTLLLSNVVVNETLPVFLDSLTGGGLLAVVISSALIVIFGEVLPQALCAQHGLKIGARCVGFVRVLMYLEAPVCWPTAKLLDWLLGSHYSSLYRREELKMLISLHSSSSPTLSRHLPADYASLLGAEQGHGGGPLSEVEVEMVNGLLGAGEKTVGEVAATLRAEKGETYVVEDGRRVCEVDLKQILLRGQPCIPVKRSRSYSSSEKSEEPFIGFVSVEQVLHALATPNEHTRSLSPAFAARTSAAGNLKENTGAVLLVGGSDASPPSPPLGFITLCDLSSFLMRPPSPDQTFTPTLIAQDAGRGSFSGGARARSSSIGLKGFVRGLVERQFAHSQGLARGHRASSSQLSFRLSSEHSSSDEAHPDDRRTRFSHSHHHSTSSIHSLRSLSNCHPSSTSPSAVPPPVPPKPPYATANGFRFPSHVYDEAEAFSLGADEDGRSSFSDSVRELEGDDSGFGDGSEGKGEVLFDARDPLAVKGG
ncbi:cell agglutination protein Mam3 [Rhodosporidiobolus nylandii]